MVSELSGFLKIVPFFPSSFSPRSRSFTTKWACLVYFYSSFYVQSGNQRSRHGTSFTQNFSPHPTSRSLSLSLSLSLSTMWHDKSSRKGFRGAVNLVFRLLFCTFFDRLYADGSGLLGRPPRCCWNGKASRAMHKPAWLGIHAIPPPPPPATPAAFSLLF